MNAVARSALLAQINKDIPQNVDWKKGAETYVAKSFDKVGDDRAGLEAYIFTKPMYALSTNPEHAARGLDEALQYLDNFLNTVRLLKLPGGAKILDVASGPGWMSHYLRRFGYQTFGFDISEDFVAYARKRLRRDPDLAHLSDSEIHDSFMVHDIERAPLSIQHHGAYDAVILESCLHHFVDPISALTHLAETLKPSGVMVIIEGENRTGPLREDYLTVMREFETLERPYARAHLHEALTLAGLPVFQTLGEVNGFFADSDPDWRHALNHLRASAADKNLTVCAKTAAALERIIPPQRHKAKPSRLRRVASLFQLLPGF